MGNLIDYCDDILCNEDNLEVIEQLYENYNIDKKIKLEFYGMQPSSHISVDDIIYHKSKKIRSKSYLYKDSIKKKNYVVCKGCVCYNDDLIALRTGNTIMVNKESPLKKFLMGTMNGLKKNQ